MLKSRWLFPWHTTKGGGPCLRPRNWGFNRNARPPRRTIVQPVPPGWPSLYHLLDCIEPFGPALDSTTEGLSVPVLNRAELSRTGVIFVALLFAICATGAAAREFRAAD